MKRKLFNNLTSIIFTMVLVLVVLSCQMGIWDSFFMHPGSHHHVGQLMSICCNSENSGSTASVIKSHKDLFSLPDNNLIYFIAFFALVSPLFSYLLKLGSLNINNYFKCIRLKYGGFKSFSYFLYLFSTGIIQPKVY